ncbi:apolipoprotein N-acyltransferase [Marinobacter sp. X15-166B]|uniref:apolipoprotein N-acyltransferase n=1 Tax=Marinobacter sp. X15-166B TaxID=1897620 RepID=UPI00085C6888|nr:apolipoprotein N-acyltransferase [Marinobacter sp. X15-166B]OEY65224.1 apolipoprotein N-acyltransferase [Marinobacter sp. X15-166B]
MTAEPSPALPRVPWPANRWLQATLLLVAGGAQTLTFSPFGWWWLAPLSLALIAAIGLTLPANQLFRAGWLVGFGLFGTGASWVYISISEYGNTNTPVAVVLTLLFVAGLALFHGVAFWFWGKLAPHSAWRRLLLLPAIWVLGDWLRGWLLTGFPWLFLGTAQVDGPLAGFAPMVGVFGLTLWIAASGSALYGALWLLRNQRHKAALALALVILAPWFTGGLAGQVQWTRIATTPTAIAAVQGNIPQQIKWDPEFMKEQIVTYLLLTEDDWDRDLILWPETAIPITQDQAGEILTHINTRLGPDSTLITGIPWYGFSDSREDFTFRNSILATGNGDGIYYKQKLVPFGEYVPLETWLRGLIGFFDLPMSSFSKGPKHQPPLAVNEHKVMPFICYEVAYPDFVATNARHTDLLVTISNDGWFGDSIGPLQHLQLARMRALETGRYMLRGTNNGVTAIIDHRGRITRAIPQFTQGTLRGDVYRATGNTPFMETGSWPTLTFAAILIVLIRERDIPRPA